MNGLDVRNGNMRITYGGRTVLDTDRRHAVLIPAEHDLTTTVTFPDAVKDWMYNWLWAATYAGASGTGSNFHVFTQGTAYISALPQEAASTQILMAVPAGCNFAAAMVRLTRTTSPNKNWNGQALTPLVPLGEWLPIAGSIHVEAGYNFSREMSIFIDSGNLVLEQKQSVGVVSGFAASSAPNPAGGADISTTDYFGAHGVDGVHGTGGRGGEWAYGTHVGTPIYTDATMTSQATVTTFTSSADATPDDRRRTTGNAHVNALASPITDPTDYSSVYGVDLKVRFGRIDP